MYIQQHLDVVLGVVIFYTKLIYKIYRSTRINVLDFVFSIKKISLGARDKPSFYIHIIVKFNLI